MVEQDLYYLFDDVYSHRGESDTNFTGFDLTQSDSLHFLQDVAHQFDDLVDQCVAATCRDDVIMVHVFLCGRCVWNGRACDRNNFEVTTTDVGVCFTFNSDVQEPLMVQQSGACACI